MVKWVEVTEEHRHKWGSDPRVCAQALMGKMVEVTSIAMDVLYIYIGTVVGVVYEKDGACHLLLSGSIKNP